MFDEGRDDGQPNSAMQYVRFPMVGDADPLPPDLALPATLAVDHRSYRHRTPLSTGVRRSPAGDLEEVRDEAPPQDLSLIHI